MKKTSPLPCVALLLLLACEPRMGTGLDSGPALASLSASPVHLVTAGGTSELEGFGAARISFVASVNGDGEVDGEFQMYAANGEVIHHADVTCLFVQGNEAWVGIEITRSENPDFVGQQALLRVVDNGEGEAVPPDQRSRVLGAAGIGTKCNEQRSFDLVDWTHGNVNVH